MKIRKYIAYCYPTSPRAIQAGQAGYYVAQEVLREDKTCSLNYMASPDVFDTVDDPDLITLLAEHNGDYCPKWCKYFDSTGTSPL